LNRAAKSVGVLAVLLFIFGCDQFQDTSKTATPAPVPVENKPPATINPELVELFDGVMQRSTAIQLSGDLRPIWIVSGRIRNNSFSELASVSIQINITSRSTSETVDGAVLVVDTDIPSGSVGSFSREVHILPPNGGFDWTYEITKAVPK
jgi:hypothetical protein